MLANKSIVDIKDRKQSKFNLLKMTDLTPWRDQKAQSAWKLLNQVMVPQE